MTFRKRILSVKRLRRSKKGKIIRNPNKSFQDYLDLGFVPTRIYTKSQVCEHDKKLLKSKKRIKL